MSGPCTPARFATDRAFSLIELLVVVAVISTLLGMVVMSSRSDQRDAAVRGAAEELAATLRATHQRAIATQQCFAVAFNIQNAPGSSGAVLNNRSGGHWYRVLGPAKRTRYVPELRNLVPWSQGKVQLNSNWNDWTTGNFPDFVADVEESWIDAPRVLPAGKVRFLALADTDEGPRRWDGSVVWYGSSSETTYPRPWFGYYDAAAGKLWPWGGYDPAKNTSGFYYEGSDGDITGCRNPSDRLVPQHDWDGTGTTVTVADIDRNGDGDTTDPYETEINWPIWRQGEPRPLVNAAWLDACLVFRPDGPVFFGEWNRARRAYPAIVPDVSKTWFDTPSEFSRGLSGIPDRALLRGSNVISPTVTVSASGTANIAGLGAGRIHTDRRNPGDPDHLGEALHFDQHTGGYHITLAPDSLDDRTDFPTAREALEAQMPAWRVFISKFGVVKTFRVQRRPGYLASLPTSGSGSPWPPTAATWLSTAANSSNPVYLNARFGRLHATTNSIPLVNTGTAITDILDPEMLSRRVWWLK